MTTRLLAPSRALFFLLTMLSTPVLWAGATGPLEGFVEVNGVRLQYLDWGGSGPALILIHGLGDNAHVFDDLAPAFANQYHVLAYTRRGSGGSDIKGPYDLPTLTEDLHRFMDALKITKAALVGHSSGGEEITEMAAEHPDRVDKIVYLDAAYDYSTEEYRAIHKMYPIRGSALPESAMASLDGFRSYQKAVWFPGLDDMQRIEADLRQKVVIQPDGTLRSRPSGDVIDAMLSALQSNKPQAYAQVRCPALAIFPEHVYDLQIADLQLRKAFIDYEQKHWDPFRTRTMEQLRREVKNVEIIRVPGAHTGFFFTSRQEVVDHMRRFLGASPSSSSSIPIRSGANK